MGWFMKLIILFFTFFSICSVGAQAQNDSQNTNVVRLEKSPILLAKDFFWDYLRHGNQSEASLEMRASELSGISAAEMIIDLIEPLMNEPETAQIRVRNMLNVLKLVLMRTNVLPEDRDILRFRLSPFLKRYSVVGSGSNHVLIGIYSRNQLWSSEEMWFLLPNLHNNSFINKYFTAILNIGKQLEHSDLFEFNEAIASSRPYTLPPMLLQFEIGQLGPQQLALLLENIFSELSPTSYGSGLHRHFPSHNISIRNSAIRVLEEIQKKYNAKDEVVVKTITERYLKSKTPEHRLFFSLFPENGLSNILFRYSKVEDVSDEDPLELKARIAELAEIAKGPLGHIEERHGNVIAVHFSAVNCSQIFTRP
jgi:hypothetical protein